MDIGGEDCGGAAVCDRCRHQLPWLHCRPHQGGVAAAPKNLDELKAALAKGYSELETGLALAYGVLVLFAIVPIYIGSHASNSAGDTANLFKTTIPILELADDGRPAPTGQPSGRLPRSAVAHSVCGPGSKRPTTDTF